MMEELLLIVIYCVLDRLNAFGKYGGGLGNSLSFSNRN